MQATYTGIKQQRRTFLYFFLKYRNHTKYKVSGIDKGIHKLRSTTDNITGNVIDGLSDTILVIPANSSKKGNNTR